MKLFKKLIAVASSLAMIATISSTAIVHAALDGTEPIVTLSQVAVSGQANTYNLTINVDTSKCTGTKIWQTTIKVPLPSEIFTNVSTIRQNYIDGVEDESENIIGDSRMMTYMSEPSYNDGLLVFQLLAQNAKQCITTAGTEGGTELIIINGLKMADNVAEDYVLNLPYVLINAGDSSNTCTSYAVGTVGTKEVNIANTVTFPKTKADEPVDPPTPEKPTVDDNGTILPIKPSDIGGEGDVFVGEDGSHAVAGLGNFTSTGTVNGIEWTIKYTPKGEAEVTKAKTFTPDWLAGANLETKMTIGLIVNYSPAEYDNVTIVSGSLN